MICCLNVISFPQPPPKQCTAPAVRGMQPAIICCLHSDAAWHRMHCYSLSFFGIMHNSIRVGYSGLCPSGSCQRLWPGRSYTTKPCSSSAVQHAVKSSTVLYVTVHSVVVTSCSASKKQRCFVTWHQRGHKTCMHKNLSDQSDNCLLQICQPNHHGACTCCRCGVRPTPLSKAATPLQHKAPPRAPTGSGPAVHSTADASGSGQDVGHRPPGSLY